MIRQFQDSFESRYQSTLIGVYDAQISTKVAIATELTQKAEEIESAVKMAAG
jgi:hypothetical protein